jgi:hypothetical protein
LPDVCSVTSVAGRGMTALPEGISYDPASGQLRFESVSHLPQYITARSMDCSGRPRDIRIHLSASKAMGPRVASVQ